MQTYQPVRILRKSYAKLGLGTQVRYSQLKLRNFAESNIYLILVKSLIDCGCSVASVDWAVVVGLILVSESALNGFSLAYLFMTQGTQPMKVGAFTVAKIRPPQHPGLWRPKQNHESSMHVYDGPIPNSALSPQALQSHWLKWRQLVRPWGYNPLVVSRRTPGDSDRVQLHIGNGTAL